MHTLHYRIYESHSTHTGSTGLTSPKTCSWKKHNRFIDHRSEGLGVIKKSESPEFENPSQATFFFKRLHGRKGSSS